MTFFSIFFLSVYSNKLFTKALRGMQTSSSCKSAVIQLRHVLQLWHFIFSCRRLFLCLSRSHTSLSVCICTAFKLLSKRGSERASKWANRRVSNAGSGGRGRTSEPNRQRWHETCECEWFTIVIAMCFPSPPLWVLCQRSSIRNNTTCCRINGCHGAGLHTLCAVAATFLLEPFKAAGSLQFQVWISSKYRRTVSVWPDQSASLLYPGFSCDSNRKLLLVNNGGCSVDVPVCSVLLEVDNKERH